MEEESERSCFFTDSVASSKKASVLLRFLVRTPAITPTGAHATDGTPGDGAFLAVFTAVDATLAAPSR